MFISLIGFGFLGGISGVMMGTEQLNLIIHNTIYVPGHFHATVVVGTTLAFMGLTYFLIPVLFRRELAFPTMAKYQPYVFGLGMSAVALFLMGAGTLGVPRRHWDITFADALTSVQFSPAAFLMLALNGIFACMAALGGAMYVIVVVWSVLFGRRIGDTEKVPLGPATGTQAAAAVASYGNEGTLRIPGTVTLVGVFFVSFVLYYYVNWKYLAELWPLR
jgi:cytochrome c oxidase subunit 1